MRRRAAVGLIHGAAMRRKLKDGAVQQSAMIGRVDPKALRPNRSRETLLPRTVTFPAAVVVTLWCVACALMADAWATPLERVEFEGASQRLISGGLIRGDHIQGYLAKPEVLGLFPRSSGCMAVAASSTRQSENWSMNLLAGVMSFYSSIALPRAA